MTELNNNMTFDEAYHALEETIRQMEAPDISFQENLRLYEQAGRLVLYCRRKLTEAREQVADVNRRLRVLKETNAPLFED